MTMAFKIVVNCDALKLEESFNGTHFGCAFFKTCQYVTIEEKICKDLKFVSIKLAESDIHKCIIWFQIFGKGGQKWSKACIDVGIQPRKLNAPIKTM